MNFKLSWVSILIAICLIKGLQGGGAFNGSSGDSFGKKITRFVTCGKLGQVSDEDDIPHSLPEETFPEFKLPDRTDFSNKIKVAENENDLQTNILPNSGDKLIIMAILDEKRKSDVVVTIDILGDSQEGKIEIIVVYLEKCKDTAELYGVNSDNPTYIFRKRETKDAICLYTRSESYQRDYILMNHKVKEILGKTPVKVAFSDEDFDEKFKSAAENELIKLTIIWFEPDIAYDVDFGHDHNLPRVEYMAKDHDDVLFIRANINACPKTFNNQKSINDKLEKISFIIFKSSNLFTFFNGFPSQEYIIQIIERPDPYEIVEIKKFKKNGKFDLVNVIHYIGDPDEPDIPYILEIEDGDKKAAEKKNDPWERKVPKPTVKEDNNNNDTTKIQPNPPTKRSKRQKIRDQLNLGKKKNPE